MYKKNNIEGPKMFWVEKKIRSKKICGSKLVQIRQISKVYSLGKMSRNGILEPNSCPVRIFKAKLKSGNKFWEKNCPPFDQSEA